MNPSWWNDLLHCDSVWYLPLLFVQSLVHREGVGSVADVINHSEAFPALLQGRQHFHDKLPFSRRLRLSWENSFSDGSWYRACPPESNVFQAHSRVCLAIVKMTQQINNTAPFSMNSIKHNKHEIKLHASLSSQD